MTRIVKDKDGRMRTVEGEAGPSPEELARLRRETRDRIQGNVPFHTDPFAAPPAPAAEPSECLAITGKVSRWVCLCDDCREFRLEQL